MRLQTRGKRDMLEPEPSGRGRATAEPTLNSYPREQKRLVGPSSQSGLTTKLGQMEPQYTLQEYPRT